MPTQYHKATIVANEVEFEVHRPGLKSWLELDTILQEIRHAAERKEPGLLAEEIVRYLSAAIEGSFWADVPWYEAAKAFTSIYALCDIELDFAVLKAKGDDEILPWDYDERTWFYWAHSLAIAYGWSLKEIETLDPTHAIALLQEIFVEEQLNKEWEWSLTELAYRYDQVTKKSHYEPLKRPSWMQPDIGSVKKLRIHKMLMPIGNVVDLGKMQEYIKTGESPESEDGTGTD